MNNYKKPQITINPQDWPANYGCLDKEVDKNLYVGDYIDRFGSEYGFFFGIAGEPYINRSLPWFGIFNLDNETNEKIKKKFYDFYSEADTNINPEHDYHIYKVIKSFPVKTCKISPAFGYPGGGVQYRSIVNVKDLIKKGVITEVPWTNSPLFDENDKIGGRKFNLKYRNKKTKRNRNRNRNKKQNKKRHTRRKK